MIKVITYGTFDLFHVGHVRLLERLKALGDELYVGISSDSFNLIKGKESFFSYEERAEIVLSCKFVDYVFSEDDWEQKTDDIKNFGIDIFSIGNDWEGEFDFLKEYCDVIYLSRTDDISTTSIKSRLSKISNGDLNQVEASLINVIEIVRAISKA